MSLDSLDVADLNQPVLMSKLNRPRLRKVLTRTRLIEKAHLEKQRLLTICAGPGYGKTTLMAQLAELHNGPKVWYQVEANDEDPAFFLRQFITGISIACEGIGKRCLVRLGEARNIEKEWESVLAVLMDEMREKLNAPLIICLDDYHLLEGSKFYQNIIGFLSKHLPAESSLILTSRTVPKIPFGRMRTQGLLQEINEAELRFSLGELERLLLDTWDLAIDKNDIEQLHEWMEGWAAGLVLTESCLRAGNDVESLQSQQRIQQNIFEYLAEEVFDHQTDETKTLLMHGALMETIDPKVCEEILGLDKVSTLLRKAENNNLFITSLEDGNQYRFHPLFKAFLIVKIEVFLSSAELNKLRCKFAETYLKFSNYDQAIELFFAAGKIDNAVEIIQNCGRATLERGEVQTISQWINRLPNEIKNNKPWICFYSGQINDRFGDLNSASNDYSRARSGFEQLNDKEGLFHCALAESYIYYLTKKQRECISAAEEAIHWASTKEDIINAKSAAATIYLWLGKINDAKDYWCEAINLCDESLEQIKVQIKIDSLATYYFSGNFKKILLFIDDMISSIDESQLLTNSKFFNNKAIALYLMGYYEEAKQQIKKALLIDKKNRDVLAEQASYDTLGQILIGLGNVEEGCRTIKKPIDKYTSAISLGSEQFNHLGSSARRSSKLNEALELHKLALISSKNANNPYALAISNVNIGAVKIRLGMDPSKDELHTARLLANKYGFEYVKTQLHFHKAWLALILGNEKKAIIEIRKCLKQASRFCHNHFMIQEGKISLPLFTTAISNDIETEYTGMILEKIGEPALGALEPLLTNQDAEIRIRAIKIIARIHTSNAITLLRRAIRDKNARVRAIAKAELGNLRVTSKLPSDILTNREMEVLGVLATGVSNRQIADCLYIAEPTVKTHVNKIFQKLGINRRLDAVLYFQQLEKENNQNTT